MGKVKRSTKKFLQKKTSGHRKKDDFRRKHKHRVETKAPNEDGDQGEIPDNVADMDVDEFLAGAFLGGGSIYASESEDIDAGDEDDLRDEGIDSSDDEDDENPPSERQTMPEPDDGNSESDVDDGNDDDDSTGVAAQNTRLKDEIASHKEQLANLKETDPEFYKYLEATDQELLAFGTKDEDLEESELSDEEAGEEEKKNDEDFNKVIAPSDQAAGMVSVAVTMAQLESWCASAMHSASLAALRLLLRAYRAACHYGDTEDSVQETMRINSSAVYNKLMLFVLKEADALLRRALDVDGEADAVTIRRAARWVKLEPLVKSYLGNTLHLLGQMTDPEMLSFVLRRIRPSVPFLAAFNKLRRRYLKSALQIFGSADAGPRVQAVLLVRTMALRLGPGAMDDCLKGVYRAFSANAKFVNAASVPHINFMAACVVELYGLDGSVSYRHAFGFVRQLALLLRQALTAASKDAYREVYCWQTINCLELWAKVLSAHAQMDILTPLVYPVVQLLLGTARLLPTPSYFPLRLRCTRALNRLARATGFFIPVAPLLLEVLQWGDLARSPKPISGEKPPEVLLQLRLGKTAARSPIIQEEIVEQVFELLADHLKQWAYHVSFPELGYLPMTCLRKFAKSTGVERFRRGARQLADAIERNIAFVGKARDSVDFAPKDLTAASQFLVREAAAGKAPVAQHAKTLLERARQRLAARSAEGVEIGAQLPGSGDVTIDEEAMLDKGNGVPETVPLPNRKKKAAHGQATTTEEKKSTKGSKSSAEASKGEALQTDSELNDEDVEDDEVEAYQFSDDEDEDKVLSLPQKNKIKVYKKVNGKREVNRSMHKLNKGPVKKEKKRRR